MYERRVGGGMKGKIVEKERGVVVKKVRRDGMKGKKEDCSRRSVE